MQKLRFAPSPTGQLHLGSARTAIFNWLYAKHTGGKFVLRIEDTDLSRSQEEYTASIIKDMQWMGMDYDEFYKQSERFPIYKSYIDKLVAEGKAYHCQCTKDDLIKRNQSRGIYDEVTKYDGHCRDKNLQPGPGTVVRVNIGPERDIIFKDVVKGRIAINTKELDDFVLWKSDGSPTYNFAVVIDDSLMGITTILRGEDHISNTAKQIILYEYLGFPIPTFGHLPMVFDTDRTPLSKRKGSTNIEYYRKQGILPEALLNYIARLGWSHGNDEIFMLEDLIKVFDITHLNKSNAVYDEKKMIWVNSKHMKLEPLHKVLKAFEIYLEDTGQVKVGRMQDNAWLSQAVDLLRSRSDTLADLYRDMIPYATEEYELDEKARELLPSLCTDTLEKAYQEAVHFILETSSYDATLEAALRQVAEKHTVAFKDLIQRIRIQLTGRTVSPDILSVMRLLSPVLKQRLSKKL
ncbi:Glutamyl-tRNA synthetase [Brevinematales bacterium NS]|nr:glutamate--tRNA ligase [Brevinematales bacterium]QJR22006.1 Glutamyl-tRNA synthetase [Brevinematales bacterium NS]